jgi:hypothetical protein
MYMPCAPCTISSDGSAAVAQHFAPVPGKYLLPATVAGLLSCYFQIVAIKGFYNASALHYTNSAQI